MTHVIWQHVSDEGEDQGEGLMQVDNTVRQIMEEQREFHGRGKVDELQSELGIPFHSVDGAFEIGRRPV